MTPTKCKHEWKYIGITYFTLEEELEMCPGDYTRHTIMAVYECKKCEGEKQEHAAIGNTPGKTEYFSKKLKPTHKHWYHKP